jgi:hypothetical protein
MNRFLKALAIASVLTVAAQAGAQAATPSAEDAAIEQLRKDARSDVQTILTATMKFTPEEASKFWALYKPYEDSRKAIGDEKLALIKSYATSYNAGPVNDERAKELTAKAVAIEEKSLASKKAFLQELSKSFPGKTVARFYMVQNRIDLLTSLELASGIPLID